MIPLSENSVYSKTGLKRRNFGKSFSDKSVSGNVRKFSKFNTEFISLNSWIAINYIRVNEERSSPKSKPKTIIQVDPTTKLTKLTKVDTKMSTI